MEFPLHEARAVKMDQFYRIFKYKKILPYLHVHKIKIQQKSANKCFNIGELI
jgi:hypothetical protein